MTNSELSKQAERYIENNNITSNTYVIRKAFIDGASYRSNQFTEIKGAFGVEYIDVGSVKQIRKGYEQSFYCIYLDKIVIPFSEEYERDKEINRLISLK